MKLKAWWQEERRYPSGDTFTRGQSILYRLVLYAVVIVLLILTVTLVPFCFFQAYEGFKVDLANRTLAEALQEPQEYIFTVAIFVCIAMLAFRLGRSVMPLLRFDSLGRWMNRERPQRR